MTIPTTEVYAYTPTDQENEQYEERLAKAREEAAKTPLTINGQKVEWVAMDGAQTAFLSCPLQELLMHGSRGGGKTDCLLWDFARDVNKDLGVDWNGILFRQTYPQLADVQAKSEKWFARVFPEARFNRAKMLWEWPGGERLLFRHMKVYADYYNYHGHNFQWIAWEELTNWSTDECFTAMFSCNRTSNPKVNKRIRATTNPYGPGHNWIKDRYNLSEGRWRSTQIVAPPPEATDEEKHPVRAAIYSHLKENKVLMEADPDYEYTIRASANNPAMLEAWLDGSWDIQAGGMFDDVWDPAVNVVSMASIPRGWRIDRAFDWGSSRPFSVGWYAKSDGSPYVNKEGRSVPTVRGDIFRVYEWYGWTGKPNTGLRMRNRDIAEGILRRQRQYFGTRRVHAGVADTAIWTEEDGVSPAETMRKAGVRWLRADKRPGSRIIGWQMIREYMDNAHPPGDGMPREHPGLFVIGDNCPQFLRIVPGAPRDDDNMDEIPDDFEDHLLDEVRYRVRAASKIRSNAGGVGAGKSQPRVIHAAGA